MRLLLFLVLGSLLGSLIGCSSATNQQAWTAAHGGELRDARQARAQAALALLGKPVDGDVQVCVLNSDIVCAYGWPNGRLFVTRALVDLLDERELAAALAHELGHLLNDGRLHSVVSLRGCANPDIEVRADAAGAQLLVHSGLSAQLMTRMLRKVNSSPCLAVSCHGALEDRIQILLQTN